jgi:cell division protein ZapA (FtsZ GTPase activity inhibitor)
MTQRYDVNIAGYTVTVKTDRSAEHMARLSELLNERVREVQKSGMTANYLNVVMLAAMKLADEVLELRGERENVERRLEQKGRDLLSVLDSALKERG